MLNLTRQEQLIIIFLLAALIAGGGVLLYRQFYREPVNPEVVSADLAAKQVSLRPLGQGRSGSGQDRSPLTRGGLPGAGKAARSEKNAFNGNPAPSEMIVHIAGAVKKPGVYRLKKGSRVIEGVEKAGGATEKANLDLINLARILSDGEMVRVPEKVKGGRRASPSSPDSGLIPGKVNLNFAGKSQLEFLPGIGSKLAQRIIDYRRKNGLFRSIEGLKKVPGIGKKKFESLKDLISVN